MRGVKPVVDVSIGPFLRLVGTDVTAASAARACLVLAPHPDDEVLGCGASIMRKIDAGTAVHLLVATDGHLSGPGVDPDVVSAIRDAELRKACQVLGIDDVATTRLGFQDGGLAQVGPGLVEAVAEAIRTHRPDEVFVTSPDDPHPDHAALGAAARTALAGTGIRQVTYPIWQWEFQRYWAETILRSFRPAVVRSDGYVERKRRAIAVYRSQLDTEAGGDHPAGLNIAFLRHFLMPFEVFFPLPTLDRHRPRVGERLARRLPCRYRPFG